MEEEEDNNWDELNLEKEGHFVEETGEKEEKEVTIGMS